MLFLKVQLLQQEKLIQYIEQGKYMERNKVEWT